MVMAMAMAMRGEGTRSRDAAGHVPPQALPVGMRFHPTDVQILEFYLPRKLSGSGFPAPIECLIKERDIYKHDPENLLSTGESFPFSKDSEMLFFTKRHPTSSRGSSTNYACRANRTTPSGVWECKSRDYQIKNGSGQVIGHKAQLAFHSLRDKKKIKTNWLMHEYRLCSDDGKFDDMVLCRIFNKERASEAGSEGNQKRQRVESQAMMSKSSSLKSSADEAYNIDHAPSFSLSASLPVTSECDNGCSQFLTDADLGTFQQWDEYLGDDAAFVLDEFSWAQIFEGTYGDSGPVVAEENGERAVKRQRVERPAGWMPSLMCEEPREPLMSSETGHHTLSFP